MGGLAFADGTGFDLFGTSHIFYPAGSSAIQKKYHYCHNHSFCYWCFRIFGPGPGFGPLNKISKYIISDKSGSSNICYG